MDWARAIERNSEALKGIVAALFAMLGLDGDVTVARLPHSVHRAVLRVLQPAESALRRLIVIAARGLVVRFVPSRPCRRGQSWARAGPPASRSSSSIHGKVSQNCVQERPKGSSRASMSSAMTRAWQPCGQHPGPRPVLLRRPMASSTPGALPAGSRPSRWHLMICRARRGVSPAGG